MAYVIKGKQKIRAWTCLTCKHKKNIVTKDVCLICKLPRPVERQVIVYGGQTFLCKAHSSSASPTVSVLRISPRPEVHLTIPMSVDSIAIRECIMEAFESSDEIQKLCGLQRDETAGDAAELGSPMSKFYSVPDAAAALSPSLSLGDVLGSPLGSTAPVKLKDQDRVQAKKAAAAALYTVQPPPPTLFDQVAANAETLLYDLDTGRFLGKPKKPAAGTGPEAEAEVSSSVSKGVGGSPGSGPAEELPPNLVDFATAKSSYLAKMRASKASLEKAMCISIRAKQAEAAEGGGADAGAKTMGSNITSTMTKAFGEGSNLFSPGPVLRTLGDPPKERDDGRRPAVKEKRQPCMLCNLEFPLSSLLGRITNQAILTWRKKRGAPRGMPHAKTCGGAQYGTALVCLFCFQFFDDSKEGYGTVFEGKLALEEEVFGLDGTSGSLASKPLSGGGRREEEKSRDKNKDKGKDKAVARGAAKAPAGKPPVGSVTAAKSRASSSHAVVQSTSSRIGAKGSGVGSGANAAKENQEPTENAFKLMKKLKAVAASSGMNQRSSVSSDSFVRRKGGAAAANKVASATTVLERPVSRMETETVKTQLKVRSVISGPVARGIASSQVASTLRNKYDSVKSVYQQMVQGDKEAARARKRMERNRALHKAELAALKLTDEDLEAEAAKAGLTLNHGNIAGHAHGAPTGIKNSYSRSPVHSRSPSRRTSPALGARRFSKDGELLVGAQMNFAPLQNSGPSQVKAAADRKRREQRALRRSMDPNDSASFDETDEGSAAADDEGDGGLDGDRGEDDRRYDEDLNLIPDAMINAEKLLEGREMAELDHFYDDRSMPRTMDYRRDPSKPKVKRALNTVRGPRVDLLSDLVSPEGDGSGGAAGPEDKLRRVMNHATQRKSKFSKLRDRKKFGAAAKSKGTGMSARQRAREKLDSGASEAGIGPGGSRVGARAGAGVRARGAPPVPVPRNNRHQRVGKLNGGRGVNHKMLNRLKQNARANRSQNRGGMEPPAPLPGAKGLHQPPPEDPRRAGLSRWQRQQTQLKQQKDAMPRRRRGAPQGAGTGAGAGTGKPPIGAVAAGSKAAPSRPQRQRQPLVMFVPDKQTEAGFKRIEAVLPKNTADAAPTDDDATTGTGASKGSGPSSRKIQASYATIVVKNVAADKIVWGVGRQSQSQVEVDAAARAAAGGGVAAHVLGLAEGPIKVQQQKPSPTKGQAQSQGQGSTPPESAPAPIGSASSQRPSAPLVGKASLGKRTRSTDNLLNRSGSSFNQLNSSSLFSEPSRSADAADGGGTGAGGGAGTEDEYYSDAFEADDFDSPPVDAGVIVNRRSQSSKGAMGTGRLDSASVQEVEEEEDAGMWTGGNSVKVLGGKHSAHHKSPQKAKSTPLLKQQHEQEEEVYVRMVTGTGSGDVDEALGDIGSVPSSTPGKSQGLVLGQIGDEQPCDDEEWQKLWANADTVEFVPTNTTSAGGRSRRYGGGDSEFEYDSDGDDERDDEIADSADDMGFRGLGFTTSRKGDRLGFSGDFSVGGLGTPDSKLRQTYSAGIHGGPNGGGIPGSPGEAARPPSSRQRLNRPHSRVDAHSASHVSQIRALSRGGLTPVTAKSLTQRIQQGTPTGENIRLLSTGGTGGGVGTSRDGPPSRSASRAVSRAQSRAMSKRSSRQGAQQPQQQPSGRISPISSSSKAQPVTSMQLLMPTGLMPTKMLFAATDSPIATPLDSPMPQSLESRGGNLDGPLDEPVEEIVEDEIIGQGSVSLGQEQEQEYGDDFDA